MRSQSLKRGFTLIELLVVIAIIAILASILFPVFAKAREKARQTTCTSQVRQLATAVQMYVQDNNGKFPGVTLDSTGVTESWSTKLDTYVGNQKMFHCPSDANTEEAAISYAYNGLLVKLNGDGVAESQISAPTDVGAVADADPSSTEGGLLGGGCYLTTASPYYKTASPRHGGVIVGYCDGHAKYAPGKTVDLSDMTHPVTRAFYMAAGLGLVDNPSGAVNDAVTLSMPSGGTTITIGGDYCTRPILMAMGEIWKTKGGTCTQMPFKGYLADVTGYQSGRAVFGTGDPGYADATKSVATIANDAMVVIVAKSSKLAENTSYFKKITDIGTDYGTGSGTINSLYSSYNGASAGVYQTYSYDSNSGGKAFFCRMMCNSSGSAISIGTATITVANDAEMVEKVAADPYGIGYCSAAFADLDRVTIVGLKAGTMSTSDTVGSYMWFPRNTKLNRFTYPETTPTSTTWPLMRTLRVFYANTANSASLGFVTALTGTATGNAGLAIQNGPLFKASFFK